MFLGEVARGVIALWFEEPYAVPQNFLYGYRADRHNTHNYISNHLDVVSITMISLCVMKCLPIIYFH